MEPKSKRLIRIIKPKQLIAPLAFLIFAHVAFPRYVVSTESMDPTISVGDYVFASRLHLLFSKPQVGEIVIISQSDGISSKPWLHRLIGKEGDQIHLFDENLLPTARRDVVPSPKVTEVSEGVVPAGYYYQSGDNLNSYHGLIPCDLVKAIVVIHFPIPWRYSKM